MEGYFFFTARLTLALSAGVPDWATRDKALRACALSSIGYFFVSGSANDLTGRLFRFLPESFATIPPQFLKRLARLPMLEIGGY
jgi:hypothetical protein